ncbi:MAG: hypothetical protein ABSB60_04935 [Terracidiphilus sp.]
MPRRNLWGLILLLSMAALCGSLLAQTEKTITIRMLDGKTGKPMPVSGYVVRVDHDPTVHADWVMPGGDGSAKLTVPANAKVLSVQGTYDASMQLYFNCDSANGKQDPVERWYAISDILATGVVAPNGCGRASNAAKIKPTAKPGEFVFMVRKMTMAEEWRN